jgi:hypothetical protein
LVNTSPWSATRWRLLICLVFSLSDIRKSWNFAYALLGVPRPVRQISKAHDFSQAFTALHCRNLLCGTSRGQLERKRFIICYLSFYSFIGLILIIWF